MMKAGWYLAVVVSMLLSLIALPAVAGDDIPMWVSQARLAYVGRSSTGTDAMVALVHVRDANRQRVNNAVVSVRWTLPDGSFVSDVATTSAQGIARFSVWAGKGTYRLNVEDVTKEGWVYTPIVVAAVPRTAR